jgi:hypothetical protein
MAKLNEQGPAWGFWQPGGFGRAVGPHDQGDLVEFDIATDEGVNRLVEGLLEAEVDDEGHGATLGREAEQGLQLRGVQDSVREVLPWGEQILHIDACLPSRSEGHEAHGEIALVGDRQGEPPGACRGSMFVP